MAKYVEWVLLFLMIFSVQNIQCRLDMASVIESADFEIIKVTGKYNATLNYTVDVLHEIVVTFPFTHTVNPFRILAESSNATLRYPVLVVVRQEKEVLSWQIPMAVETTRKDAQLLFFNTSRTVCHNSMESIVHKMRDLVFSSGHISVGKTSELKYASPKLLSTIYQYFIVVLATSSPKPVNVSLTVTEENNFYVEKGVEYSVAVSPSQPRYVMYRFKEHESDTLIIEIESVDDVCLKVSVQNASCPVFDLNRDITYAGQYQTITTKGAITVARRQFPDGFFLVFVSKPDNFDCTQEHSILPMPYSKAFKTANRTSVITFRVKNSIDEKDYVFAVVITFVFALIFCMVSLMMVCLFNVYGSISKLVKDETDGNNELELELYDDTQPVSRVEIERYLEQDKLTLKSLAKYPMKDRRRSFNYLWHILSIAIFYSIPVVQLVITYQRVVNQTGNEDMCYYNFLCAHPAFGLSDFNHVYSNIGYCVTGVLFLAVVLQRQITIPIKYELGIPVHYGLFYAMGIALMIEGLLSACYHICPSQSNYQFDTSFMYVMAVLCMVKLYQNRHPDINATAYATFTVLGLAIFIAMVGILDGSLAVWIMFAILYVFLCLYISFKVYFLSYVMTGLIKLKNDVQDQGIKSTVLAPVKKVRFLLLLAINIINHAILITSLVLYNKGVTDFGTFLLVLLMGNAIIYCIFYTMMKLVNKERICIEAIIYGLLAVAFWIAATIFFLDAATLWTVTPAESRTWNKDCIVMKFFDKHDIWHLLSAPALYFTFMFLMCLDDDIFDKRQNEIVVF